MRSIRCAVCITEFKQKGLQLTPKTVKSNIWIVPIYSKECHTDGDATLKAIQTALVRLFLGNGVGSGMLMSVLLLFIHSY